MTAPEGREVATLADVERELAELWREASTDGQAVLRACSLNLIVVCDDEAGELQRATELVGQIAETVPGRALVVAPVRSAGEQLDVWVSAHCHRGGGGRQVCSEQVTIDPTRAALDRVPGTILQLLAEDMPVYTWWRRGELRGGALLEPLVAMSDYWVVDSARCNSPSDQLRMLRALTARDTWRGRVLDVAWARLEPWRDAAASFFDNPALRPALERLVRVEIAAGGPSVRHGATVAGAYLAGWLLSRLGLRSEDGRWRRADGSALEIVFCHRTQLAPGEIGTATLEAEHRDAPVVFRATLPEGRDDCLVLTVEAEEHRLPPRRIQLPALDEAALLCGVLQRTGRDPVFEAALGEAAGLV